MVPPKMHTESTKFSNPDDVDVSDLSCEVFVDWLSAKGFSSHHCIAFRGEIYNYIVML